MEQPTNAPRKFHFLDTLLFALFCIAIGQVSAMVITGWIDGKSYDEMSKVIKAPIDSDRTAVLTLALLSTTLQFVIVPGIYLWITNKKLLLSVFENTKINAVPLLLIMTVLVALIPLSTILIEFNQRLTLPGSLNDLEVYIKAYDLKARQLMQNIFDFSNTADVLKACLIVAIVPGIAEEFFFRGILQKKLQNSFANDHIVIFVTAFLFSFLHLQFYEFLHKFLLGALLGYLYFWSENIWYPIIAHIINNLIGILSIVYFASVDLNRQQNPFIHKGLLLASAIMSFIIILALRRTLSQKN